MVFSRYIIHLQEAVLALVLCDDGLRLIGDVELNEWVDLRIALSLGADVMQCVGALVEVDGCEVYYVHASEIVTQHKQVSELVIATSACVCVTNESHLVGGEPVLTYGDDALVEAMSRRDTEVGIAVRLTEIDNL